MNASLFSTHRARGSALLALYATLALFAAGPWLITSASAQTPPATVISLGGPAVPAGLDDVIAIAAGYGQQLAVHSNGIVVSWGTTGGPISPPPSNLSNAVAVASGFGLNAALRSDGTVVGWGHSTPPAGLSGVTAIAAGQDSMLALKSDSTAVMWGAGLHPPSPATNCAAITVVSDTGIAVMTDGTIPANPNLLNANGPPLTFPGASNVIAAAGTGMWSLWLLHPDGTVSGFDQIPPAGLSNVVAISRNLALRSDGSVVDLGAGTPIPGLTNVLAISGAVGNGLVLTRWPAILQPPKSLVVNGGASTNFTVTAAGAPPLSYQWRLNGTNLNGATASSLTISNAQPTDAGTYDVVVANNAGAIASLPATLTVNGFPTVLTPPASATLFTGMRMDLTVAASGTLPLSYQWRHNGSDLSGATTTILSLNNVQPGDGGGYAVVVTNSLGSVTSAPGVITISSNSFKLPVPGTVVGLGGPPVPPGLTNVVAIAVSYGQALAARSDGTVAVWGQPTDPIGGPPSNLSNVVAVAGGGVINAALKSDGTVVSWGHSSTPPPGLFGVVAIAAGRDTCLGLKADGTAVTWGPVTAYPPSPASSCTAIAIAGDVGVALLNDGTVPPTLNLLNLNGPPQGFPGASNVTPIAGSGQWSLALLHGDGTVSGFDLSLPAGLSNVVAISGGLALKNDGSVVGLNAPAPPGLTNVIAVAGSVGYGLVLTTNPPPPVLAGGSSGGNFVVGTPLSVPGYVLLSSDSPTGPFTAVAGYTNGVTDTNGIIVPMNGPKQYYRLRKQ